MTRRRRLTIAALALLVLGGGLWWSTRPRIDPRLIGTWSNPPHPSAAAKGVKPQLFTFHEDGSAETWWYSTQTFEYERHSGFDWEVRQGSLYLTFPASFRGINDLARFAEQQGRRFTGRSVTGEYVSGWRIVSVADDRLTLEFELPGMPTVESVWTRVDDSAPLGASSP